MSELGRMVKLGLIAVGVGGGCFALITAHAAATQNNASIQDLMISTIDPNADALWESVGVEETKAGTKYRAPKTAAEWRRVEENARRLIEGARALQRPGLPVGGKTHGRLADADTPGTRTPLQIRADIDRDPRRFVAAAERLRLAGGDALAASLGRNSERLTTAGARIDAACEACHAAYWYPRKRLLLPSAETFGRAALRP